MKRVVALLCTSVLLSAGCGTKSSATAPTRTPSRPTSPATKLFIDPHLQFSFRYPAGWQPHAGLNESPNDVRTYVTRISVPGNRAGPEITMTGAKGPLPSFKNGEVKVEPNVGPGKFQYFQVRVSGRLGMQVRHILSTGLSEIDTFVEGDHRLLDVRMIVPNPPIAGDLLADYQTIVSTLKIPAR